MMINPYSIPNFIISILIIIFGFLTFLKNKKSNLNKIVFFWSISIFVWLFSYAICFNVKNEFLAEICTRIACTGVIYISVFAYHFIVSFLELKKELKIIRYCYLINLLLTPFFLFTNSFLSGVNHFFWGYYGKATHLYSFYLLYSFMVLARALFLMYNAMKHENLSLKKRMQARYIFTGFIIASFSIIDYLPKYGIEIYPLGNIFMFIWTSIAIYTILKHNLMDINIVIRKGLVYSILISIITIIYLCIVMSVERIFQGIIGYRSLLISIIFAAVIALIFIPLKNKIQTLIDRVFLGKTSEQIARENELLREELFRSEKLKTIATFASGMAHEIKNPLTAIKTFTEYLPQKGDEKEFRDKYSKIVGSEVDKIDDLVHQLLDYSKPGPLQLIEVDIHKLMDETLELLNNQFINNEIKAVKDYALNAKRYMLMLDSKQIKQAFLNLFLNAIEAMPKGGTLTVATDVIRDNSLQKEFVQIRVQDTGCGISEKDLSHIFEPFFSTKEKGSGLGLSIVYNIIKQHSGEIYAESKIGKGTSSIIKLPIIK